MQYRKDICTCHNQERYIVKRLPGKKYCEQGNRERLDSKKDKAKPRNPRRKPKKATGERDLFLAIWAVRPHYCTNCSKYLGSEPKVHYFAHIKSKGAHPELRLEPKNIRLLCIPCHQAYDFEGEEKFNSLSKGAT